MKNSLNNMTKKIGTLQVPHVLNQPSTTPWRRMGSGCIDPRFLDLGTSWRWVVSFTPRPLYPQGKSPWYPLYRRWLDPRTGLYRGSRNLWMGLKTLTTTRLLSVSECFIFAVQFHEANYKQSDVQDWMWISTFVLYPANLSGLSASLRDPCWWRTHGLM
jgi:hypothetical protein